MASKGSTNKKNVGNKNGRNNAMKQKRRSNSRSIDQKNSIEVESSIIDEIKIWGTLALSLFLMVSHFGFGGVIGNTISKILFGLFGIFAFIMPILLFVGVTFIITNRGNSAAYIKMIAAVIMCILFCMLAELVMNGYDSSKNIFEYYKNSCAEKNGGGILGGIFVSLLCLAIGEVGTYLAAIIIAIICVVIISEKSLLRGVKKGGEKVYHSAKTHNSEAKIRRQEKLNTANAKGALPDKGLSNKMGLRRKDKVVSGVTFNTTLENTAGGETKSPEIREIVDFGVVNKETANQKSSNKAAVSDEPLKPEDVLVTHEEPSGQLVINRARPLLPPETELDEIVSEEQGQIQPLTSKKKKTDSANKKHVESEVNSEVEKQIQKEVEKPKKIYKFPPLSLLKRGKITTGDSDDELRQTAAKLEQTLQNFGVDVTVTNVSCGPTVTRYELQPEMGVKVSRIVGLADDIKLNLAASDIRIEAPIPGKAAVGIEVPNKENSAVMLRDLLESEEFRNHKSKIAFATGRDIAGQVVVSDIAKMPHVLIAGRTGSGKSVCINTLIMSILYKATPDEVRLIMIDPKVVELGVYNGIPHLLIPVVTDPKKAAGALNWAVTEMTRRYQLFAEYNARDLEGYNKKIEDIKDIEDENKPKKMPQIVIIVDELADLMMVAPGDVEDAICRLAQLARAAGIHLVLATQRPSVNVITGLIKANMPSRIAFAVSSGVDSRTILDMNGAEKLLGKGDMLFSTSGYPKPVRMQGALVTDTEIQAVVDFLIHSGGTADYDENISNQVNSNSIGNHASMGNADDRDVYFVDAGKFVIEKDKASIGMLQRVFKIGFNRAARIMDQLAEAGVVGEEEGTKPRKVLMSMEQFEQYIEEYLLN